MYMQNYTYKQQRNKGLRRTKRASTFLEITNNTSHVKRGGISPDITNNNFRYTKSIQRKKWVTNIYPALEHLVNLIVDADWSLDYIYNGPITINAKVFTQMNGKPIVESTMEDSTLDNVKLYVKGNLKPVFAGGICCELLNDQYQPAGAPNLHTFVDPTGDIDGNLTFPPFIIHPIEMKPIIKMAEGLCQELIHQHNVVLSDDKEIIVKIYPPILLANGIINPHYANVIFSILTKCHDAINIDTIPQDVLRNTARFDVSEYNMQLSDKQVSVTNMVGLQSIQVGNLHLVAFIHLSNEQLQSILETGEDLSTVNVLVQLVAKFNDDDLIDHCLEFLVNVDINATFDGVSYDDLVYPFNIQSINERVQTGYVPIPVNEFIPEAFVDNITNKYNTKIKIQLNTGKFAVSRSISILLSNNLDAYFGRLVMLEKPDEYPNSGHKAYNHVGRILYLLALVQYFALKERAPGVKDTFNYRDIEFSFIMAMKAIPKMALGFRFAKIDYTGGLRKYIITIQDLLLAFAPVFLKMQPSIMSSLPNMLNTLLTRANDSLTQTISGLTQSIIHKTQANLSLTRANLSLKNVTDLAEKINNIAQRDEITNYNLSSPKSKKDTLYAYSLVINGPVRKSDNRSRKASSKRNSKASSGDE